MEQISVGIIGAGQIAGGYDQKKLAGDTGVYTHAGAYTIHGKYKLTSVFDVDQKQVELFQEYWNVEQVAASLEEIYKGYHDVISLCTPDGTHFEILRELLRNNCCKTIFVEKPIALHLGQIEEITKLAHSKNMNVVVNFQRKNEKFHNIIRDQIISNFGEVLTGNAYYIKGLEHIGITMIDTLTYLLGYPKEVLTYNRVYNSQVDNYTYEFILFFDGFNITIKTVDSHLFNYNYHIFEIDILFATKRITINDNSRQIEIRNTSDYAYAGVKTLNDRNPYLEETRYKVAMLDAVDYIYKITKGELQHKINTPEASFNNKLIIDKVIESYDKGCKISFGGESWKK